MAPVISLDADRAEGASDHAPVVVELAG